MRVDPGTGEAPLHVAVTQNNEAIVTQLLDLGASLTTQDLDGRTPVMKACEYGHLQSLEVMGMRGIDMAGEEREEGGGRGRGEEEGVGGGGEEGGRKRREEEEGVGGGGKRRRGGGGGREEKGRRIISL